MLNVLLIEDDMDLANTVVQYLELENIACDHASNGVSGFSLTKQNNYDALLLDLNLPKLDGLSVCEKMRQQGNDTPVLMLTARDQLQDKLDGFRVGTDDFLVKPFELEELVVRIQALAKRRSGQTRVLQCADLTMNLDSKSITRAGKPIKVSPIGWKILELLLRASPNVLSRTEIETAIWDDEPPDSNSFKVHLFKLRKAVDEGYTSALLHTIVGQGFAIQDPSSKQPHINPKP